MSNYDQPATWADVSGAVGKPVLIQTAAPLLQPRESLLGVFDLELDQLLPLYWWGSTSNWNLWRSAYRVVRQIFHGRSWSGKSGTAMQFWKAVRTTRMQGNQPDHDRFVLVLTERRMLILSQDARWKGNEPYKADVRLELPSGSYVLKPDAPASRFTHRFDLAFDDGTWIALSAGWKSKKYNAQHKETLRLVTSLLTP